MNVYIAHASNFNYQEELYDVLKESSLWSEHEFTLPHENNKDGIPAKELIKNVDVVFAEVSYPSTGQGIELGWAESFGKKIVAFHKNDITPSSALRFIGAIMYPYANSEQLIATMTESLNT